MKSLIDRLIQLGYDRDTAERIYLVHEETESLSSLYGYVEARERVQRGGSI